MIGLMRTPDAELRFPHDGYDFTHWHFDHLLMWAADEGCSDIRLEAGKEAIVQRHGRMIRVTRPLTLSEIEGVAKIVYAADAIAHFNTKQDFNLAYEPKRDRDKRYRFRVNGFAALQWGNDGPAIVARVLPSDPVPLASQNVPADILRHLCPPNGIIVTAGSTGSGKTTFQSGAVLRELTDPDSHKAIATLESPIEQVFDGLGRGSSEITQLEIGRHLMTFDAGVRSLVRGNYDIIVVGECRDAETMVAAIQAAQANHRVLLTVHAGSIYETFERMVSLCPVAVRAEMTAALAQSVRLVINQKLIPSVDGTRTPIREWMVCHQSIRRMLGISETRTWPTVMENMAEARMTNFASDIGRALEEGRITEAVAVRQLEELRM